MISVEFPDEESLRAATRAIGAVVNAEGAIGDAVTDTPTPAYRAERALDSALLAHEESRPVKVWTLAVLLHVAADTADDAVRKVEDGLLDDGPVTVTRPDGRYMEFLYMNLPEEAQYAYDLSDLSTSRTEGS